MEQSRLLFVALSLLVGVCISSVQGSCNKLTTRVDDDQKVYADGYVILDTFVIPGFQWRQTYMRELLCAKVLVMKMYNQGGPGDVWCDIDGVDCTTMDWKCNVIGANQEPEQRYPGIHGLGFDDSSWGGFVKRRRENRDSWWGGQQSRRYAVCRLVMAEKITIRTDDDQKVYADGVVVLDTFTIPGFQWRDTYNRILPPCTKVLVVKVYNQGGPGTTWCSIDGVDCTTMNWKCNTIGANQEPEQAYPGIHNEGFNDSAWGGIVTQRRENRDAWWGGPQSRRYAVCRVVLGGL